MTDDENLTAEDMELLQSIGLGYPKEEEKQGIFTFFKRVINMPDTTRTANLDVIELGAVKVPFRTWLHMRNYCKAVGLNGVAGYFFDEAQVISGSSLSKDGFLDRIVVTQKKEMISGIKEPRKENKGWFKKKEQPNIAEP